MEHADPLINIGNNNDNQEHGQKRTIEMETPIVRKKAREFVPVVLRNAPPKPKRPIDQPPAHIDPMSAINNYFDHSQGYHEQQQYLPRSMYPQNHPPNYHQHLNPDQNYFDNNLQNYPPNHHQNHPYPPQHQQQYFHNCNSFNQEPHNAGNYNNSWNSNEQWSSPSMQKPQFPYQHRPFSHNEPFEQAPAHPMSTAPPPNQPNSAYDAIPPPPQQPFTPQANPHESSMFTPRMDQRDAHHPSSSPYDRPPRSIPPMAFIQANRAIEEHKRRSISATPFQDHLSSVPPSSITWHDPTLAERNNSILENGAATHAQADQSSVVAKSPMMSHQQDTAMGASLTDPNEVIDNHQSPSQSPQTLHSHSPASRPDAPTARSDLRGHELGVQPSNPIELEGTIAPVPPRVEQVDGHGIVATMSCAVPVESVHTSPASEPTATSPQPATPPAAKSPVDGNGNGGEQPISPIIQSPSSTIHDVSHSSESSTPSNQVRSLQQQSPIISDGSHSSKSSSTPTNPLAIVPFTPSSMVPSQSGPLHSEFFRELAADIEFVNGGDLAVASINSLVAGVKGMSQLFHHSIDAQRQARIQSGTGTNSVQPDASKEQMDNHNSSNSSSIIFHGSPHSMSSQSSPIPTSPLFPKEVKSENVVIETQHSPIRSDEPLDSSIESTSPHNNHQFPIKENFLGEEDSDIEFIEEVAGVSQRVIVVKVEIEEPMEEQEEQKQSTNLRLRAQSYSSPQSASPRKKKKRRFLDYSTTEKSKTCNSRKGENGRKRRPDKAIDLDSEDSMSDDEFNTAKNRRSRSKNSPRYFSQYCQEGKKNESKKPTPDISSLQPRRPKSEPEYLECSSEEPLSLEKKSIESSEIRDDSSSDDDLVIVEDTDGNSQTTMTDNNEVWKMPIFLSLYVTRKINIEVSEILRRCGAPEFYNRKMLARMCKMKEGTRKFREFIDHCNSLGNNIVDQNESRNGISRETIHHLSEGEAWSLATDFEGSITQTVPESFFAGVIALAAKNRKDELIKCSAKIQKHLKRILKSFNGVETEKLTQLESKKKSEMSKNEKAMQIFSLSTHGFGPRVVGFVLKSLIRALGCIQCGMEEKFKEIQAPFKPDASGVTHNIRNELLEKNRYDTRRLTEIEEPRIDRHQPITITVGEIRRRMFGQEKFSLIDVFHYLRLRKSSDCEIIKRKEGEIKEILLDYGIEERKQTKEEIKDIKSSWSSITEEEAINLATETSDRLKRIPFQAVEIENEEEKREIEKWLSLITQSLFHTMKNGVESNSHVVKNPSKADFRATHNFGNDFYASVMQWLQPKSKRLSNSLAEIVELE